MLSLTVTFLQLSFVLWSYLNTPDTATACYSNPTNVVSHHTIPKQPAAYYFSTNNLGHSLSTKYVNPNKESSVFWILLISSSYADIEANPGPRKPKYPCENCGKPAFAISNFISFSPLQDVIFHTIPQSITLSQYLVIPTPYTSINAHTL